MSKHRNVYCNICGKRLTNWFGTLLNGAYTIRKDVIGVIGFECDPCCGWGIQECSSYGGTKMLYRSFEDRLLRYLYSGNKRMYDKGLRMVIEQAPPEEKVSENL